jgi:hypothetical protein
MKASVSFIKASSGGTAVLLVLAASGATWGQQADLAVRGQGLLAEPAGVPAKLEGVPPTHPFACDASGTLSRTIFASDEDPNFRIVVREVSVPPDHEAHALNLPSAVVQLRGSVAEISINKRRVEPAGGGDHSYGGRAG